MKFFLILTLIIGSITAGLAKDGYPDKEFIPEYKDESKKNDMLMLNSNMVISVVGQGVAPSFATSPAQAYALAKRAAMADAYRLIAERVKGVQIQGKDSIKNMAIKSTTVNTQVEAMIRNATVVETTFKDGMSEVEMEIRISYNNFK